MFKKTKSLLWMVVLIVLLLCSCQAGNDPVLSSRPPQNTEESAEPASHPAPTSVPTPIPTPTPTPEPTTSPSLDFSIEPPLDEYSASIAVPDFLTEEQQGLYRRAHCLYLNLFGVTPANVDRLGDPQNGSSNETVVIDDMTYTFSHGRYRSWEDFDALVHAVFTERFWEERNNPVSAAGEPRILFREYNGLLCYLETEKEQGNYYNENFPDEFHLDEQTEEEISFTLIGHYSWVYPKEGETSEERDARRKREYDCTQEFSIEMVLTEDGWRFDEFHSALVDE